MLNNDEISLASGVPTFTRTWVSPEILEVNNMKKEIDIMRRVIQFLHKEIDRLNTKSSTEYIGGRGFYVEEIK